jgi:2-desacetyl-2-hydroxyethyl bacteriochlorophyllide A dehydrogenase
MMRFVALGTAFRSLGKWDLRSWFDGIYGDRASDGSRGHIEVHNIDILAELPRIQQVIRGPKAKDTKAFDDDDICRTVEFGAPPAEELMRFPTAYFNDERKDSLTIDDKYPKQIDCIRAVEFAGPRIVRVVEDAVPELGGNQLLLKTICSMVSTGTELKLFKGDIDSSQPTDLTISGMSGRLSYPLRYGYSLVGRVVAVGNHLNESDWLGKRVFSFSPHASAVVIDASSAVPIPEDISSEDAVYFPAMETAVSLVQSARPAFGERTLVVGQGLIGMLVGAVLVSMNSDVTLADVASPRLLQSRSLNRNAKFWNPREARSSANSDQFDVSIEVSGNSGGLQTAIDNTGNEGRIVLGSLYGEGAAAIKLGMRFHRSGLKLVTSQVSVIPPELAGRWDKARRFDLTWKVSARICEEHTIQSY